jgi:Na+-driven multidrug efflux pump
MPAMAVGAAVSAMAAQNIGAGRWDRVDRITRAGLVMNLALTGGLVALLTLLDRHVLWLFLGQDGGAIGIATRINLIAGWSFILFGVSMVLSATVRANGAVVGPLVILAIAMGPVRFGLAYALEPMLGADAIWWSFPAGSLASMLLTIAYYARGGWRRGRIATTGSAEAAGPDAQDATGDGAGEQTRADCEPTARSMPVG